MSGRTERRRKGRERRIERDDKGESKKNVEEKKKACVR